MDNFKFNFLSRGQLESLSVNCDRNDYTRHLHNGEISDFFRQYIRAIFKAKQFVGNNHNNTDGQVATNSMNLRLPLDRNIIKNEQEASNPMT